MAHSTGTCGSVIPTINLYTNRPVETPFRAGALEAARELDAGWPRTLMPLGPLGLLQYSPGAIKRALGEKRAKPYIGFRNRTQALLKKRARKVSGRGIGAVITKAARRGRGAVAKVAAGDALTTNDRSALIRFALALLEEQGICTEEFARRFAKRGDDDAATAGQGAESEDEGALVIASTN